MSYLLEALRKSERERQEKTAVPDLQTPTVEWESAEEPRQRSPWLTVAVIAICLNTILLALLVWRFGFAGNDNARADRDSNASVTTNPPPQPSNAAAAMPPVIVVQQPASANEAIVVRDRPRPELITPNSARQYPRSSGDESRNGQYDSGSMTSSQTGSQAGTQADRQASQQAFTQSGPQPAQRDANREQSSSTGFAAGSDSADGNTADNRAGNDNADDGSEATPSIHSLPLEIRQQLPILTMNSHIYASNARDSFVMINGSAFGPGQAIVAGLKLVAVVPEGAVLEFKGHRFLLPALASFSP
ncbi:general secretion pathway protein GspB [Permianibacter sp. IMCC34836]|uniref:general secretion pathway protein GspB n=1 Tax=Permianibacter fluminis TaxID=2738515 RepID=UPI0015559252|nr:general secretion pathway protein GspB [Permianibacter fluminis]NQD36423.1 general secretion pathway protein GspB [Permianibacter fluminis]